VVALQIHGDLPWSEVIVLTQVDDLAHHLSGGGVALCGSIPIVVTITKSSFFKGHMAATVGTPDHNNVASGVRLFRATPWPGSRRASSSFQRHRRCQAPRELNPSRPSTLRNQNVPQPPHHQSGTYECGSSITHGGVAGGAGNVSQRNCPRLHRMAVPAGAGQGWGSSDS
jgi:hypothetical protein